MPPLHPCLLHNTNLPCNQTPGFATHPCFIHLHSPQHQRSPNHACCPCAAGCKHLHTTGCLQPSRPLHPWHGQGHSHHNCTLTLHGRVRTSIQTSKHRQAACSRLAPSTLSMAKVAPASASPTTSSNHTSWLCNTTTGVHFCVEHRHSPSAGIGSTQLTNPPRLHAQRMLHTTHTIVQTRLITNRSTDTPQCPCCS